MKTIRTMFKNVACVLPFACLISCASQDPNLLNNALDALNNAGNAQECAAETYALAQDALKQAQEAQANGDEELAKQKARLAQTLAQQAKQEAEMNAEDCERRKNASAAIDEKLNVVDELSDAKEFVLDESFKVIYFDFDESFLSSQAVYDLQANVAVLKAKPEMTVILASHTDERGTTEYNLALSQKRGDAVKNHAQSMGIEPTRMAVVPYGKEQPASSGSRDQDYALNRRVEFIAR